MKNNWYNKITSSIKDNITPILFIGMIVFVVATIVYDNRLSKEQIRNLIEYTESTTPYIIQTTTLIANESLIAENTEESYSTTLADLNELLSFAQNRKSQIPEIPNDPKAEQLQQVLMEYLDSVINTCDDLILQQTTIRELQPQLQSVSQSESIMQSGNITEIAQLVDAAIILTERIDSLEVDDSVIRYLRSEYFTSYESLTSLSQVDPDDPSSISAYVNSPQSSPPLNKVLYPAIRRYQVEDREYVGYITSMQDIISELKVQYSL